jgi:hypothetical protein
VRNVKGYAEQYKDVVHPTTASALVAYASSSSRPKSPLSPSGPTSVLRTSSAATPGAPNSP